MTTLLKPGTIVPQPALAIVLPSTKTGQDGLNAAIASPPPMATAAPITTRPRPIRSARNPDRSDAPANPSALAR